MMNIWIRWYCGFFACVDMNRLSLKSNVFYLYDEKGEVVKVDLTDSVQFDMRVECEFNFRKKANFTRGEVFAIYHKGNEYDLYIPMSAVNFKKLEKKEHLSDDGMYVRTTRRCAFDAYDLNFWNPNCDQRNFYVNKLANRLNFEVFVSYERTNNGERIETLCKDIQKDCGVYILPYDMKKILEKYKIIKKD